MIHTDGKTSDSTICYANRAFAQITGYRLEELLGQSARLLHGPKTDTEVTERMNAHYEAGNKARGESINYCKDGSEFTMQWQVFPVIQAGEKIAGALACNVNPFEIFGDKGSVKNNRP